MSDRTVHQHGDRVVRDHAKSDAMFAPSHWAPRVRDSMRGESLWTLQKDGERLSAEIKNHGSHGLELQVLCNGEVYFGHRHAWREFALEEAAARRRTLEAYGWQTIDRC
jgi:hypothetical protein